MNALIDRVALVTGAAGGIGTAICRELAAYGASVVVNDLDLGAAEHLARELSADGGPSLAIRADVGNRDEVDRMVNETIQRFGRIDILVNNAGIVADRTLRKLSDEDWRRVLHINLDSVFYCSSAVVPHMVERRWGRIISLSSVVGQTGNFGQTSYGASKAGILGFTKSAARELARYNITVNAICPGFVDTPMIQTIPDEIRDGILKQIPLGRFARPEEIARAIRFLVVDGDYITGQEISINGGFYM